LTAWRVSLPDELARMLEGQGIVLHPLGSGTYQLRLAEVEGRLLNFQGLRDSFRGLLARRNADVSPLEEILSQVGFQSAARWEDATVTAES
jgi:hypothetical protein